MAAYSMLCAHEINNMANLTRNFTQGKMNKMVDERLVPNGEYIDALNVRMGSTEAAEIGVIENSKGNEQLTNILYENTPLSSDARCIGAFEDGVNFTAGLSVVRTSPGHGTAYDIAGQNLAKPDSFRAAVYLALDIYRNRKIYDEVNANPLPLPSQIDKGKDETINPFAEDELK